MNKVVLDFARTISIACGLRPKLYYSSTKQAIASTWRSTILFKDLAVFRRFFVFAKTHIHHSQQRHCNNNIKNNNSNKIFSTKIHQYLLQPSTKNSNAKPKVNIITEILPKSRDGLAKSVAALMPKKTCAVAMQTCLQYSKSFSLLLLTGLSYHTKCGFSLLFFPMSIGIISFSVIPAQAGIQKTTRVWIFNWIPRYLRGMTRNKLQAGFIKLTKKSLMEVNYV